MTNSSPDLWSRCSYWSKVVNAKWVFSLFPLRDVKIPVRLQMEVSRMSCHFQSAQFTCYLLISCCSLFSWFERACIITPSLLFADFHNWNNNIQLTVPHPCNSSIPAPTSSASLHRKVQTQASACMSEIHSNYPL